MIKKYSSWTKKDLGVLNIKCRLLYFLCFCLFVLFFDLKLFDFISISEVTYFSSVDRGNSKLHFKKNRKTKAVY